MIVDGKKLAEQVKVDLTQKIDQFIGRGITPGLGIILVGDNPMSIKYAGFKKAMGESIKARVEVVRLPADSDFASVADTIKKFNQSNDIHGMIVQLPLPAPLDGRREEILNLIDPAKDVDALTKVAKVLSPVVAAVKYILDQAGLIAGLAGKQAVVIGRGQLVGRPAAVWLESLGVKVAMISSKTPEAERLELLRAADLVVAGAGVPNLIKSNDIKEGVILIDGSTSDVSGKVVGDIDPACADKALLYTPVPGGVGPLTVVMLFSNLLELVQKR